MKYMKTNHIIKTAIVMAAGILTLTSCEDWLTIYPTDKTVGENFWTKKSDVDEMATAAYSAMTSGGIQERVIMWGAYRSDELVQNSGYNNIDFENVALANLYPKQGICSWSDFYAVINRCNIVLKHAPEVMEKDPDFTNGDYETVRAQMLALRSFCYFYLVRSFRDVPYPTTSFESDDEDMSIAQSSPAEVLKNCIADLEMADTTILKSGAYGLYNWRNVGYFTRDAVDALLADIYLWRGSITHNAEDYRKCVEYADKVIASRDEYFQKNHPSEIGTDARSSRYHLHNVYGQFVNFGEPYSAPFLTDEYGNHSMSESILEWQSGNNDVLGQYYMRENDNSTTSRLMASQIFKSTAVNANQVASSGIFLSNNDFRFWNVVCDVNQPDTKELNIRKFVNRFYRGNYSMQNPSAIIVPNTVSVGAARSIYSLSNFDRNWVAYRITDVMLMKAEALVQLSASDDDEPLKQAFNLVQVVNKRSMLSTAVDTLKYDSYKQKNEMELLVLAERERELCFEGKRWYDLLRYFYRRMEGVNIEKLMSDEDYPSPALPSGISNFLTRKFPSGGSSVTFKMKTEPSLYWPIQESEMKVNSLLRQNPVFQDNSSISKN